MWTHIIHLNEKRFEIVGSGRKVAEGGADNNVGECANTNERSVRQLLDKQTK